MKHSFTTPAKGHNTFSREFGGTTKLTADPYVTGYHHIAFAKLPDALSTYIAENPAGVGGGDVKNLLSASCLSVTPPGGTLNKIEYTGLGGIKWSVPGNIDYGTSVSIKFLEYNGLPISNIFHEWFKFIRDYRHGTSRLEDKDTKGYTKGTYAGSMFYWTTAPDGITVEYYACYDGMFPLKDPQDLFASDVDTVGRLDVEMEFNVDHVWHEKWVYDKCVNLSQGLLSQADGLINGRKVD